jgi:hypothetical protein
MVAKKRLLKMSSWGIIARVGGLEGAPIRDSSLLRVWGISHLGMKMSGALQFLLDFQCLQTHPEELKKGLESAFGKTTLLPHQPGCYTNVVASSAWPMLGTVGSLDALKINGSPLAARSC